MLEPHGTLFCLLVKGGALTWELVLQVLDLTFDYRN